MENKVSNHINVVAIIQARMSASRLPGKVLLDIGGEPMLVRVVERSRRARFITEVVVATSDDQSDNPIAELCVQRNYTCFRGDLFDVLDRYYQAAKTSSAQAVVRITADCPIIDPLVIDQTIAAFFGFGVTMITRKDTVNKFNALNGLSGISDWDFAANRLPPPWHRTFPIGLDTEVCTFVALEHAWRKANQPHQREHVMPYLYDNKKEFRCLLVNHDPDCGHYRWTVDTPQDLELLRQIYAHFDGRDDFSWYEILDLMKREPELELINNGIKHKDYRVIDERE